MTRYLTLILLKLFVISLISSYVCFFFILRTMSAGNQANVSNVIFGLSFIILFILTVGATTIYLNLLEKIRANKYYCILSFFVLPVILSVQFLFYFGDLELSTLLLYSSLFVPFLLALTYFYFDFLKFRKTIG